MCLSSLEYTDTQVRPGGEWVSAVEAEPTDDGTQSRLVMWSVQNPDHSVVLLSGTATGRGLSGGVHVWSPDGEHVYVVTREQGVVDVAVTGDQLVSVRSLAFDATKSWSTPSVRADGRTVCVVADWREVWVCDLGTNTVRCDHVADAFAFDCAIGNDVRFHTWDRPHMPWTQSRIHPARDVAGRAVQQPRFSADGRGFGYIDDSRGVNNVCIVADAIVDNDSVIDDECEHGGPTWGPGQRTWCFNSDATKVAYTRNENGFGSLWVYDRLTNERHHIGKAVHGCVSWEGNTLAAVRSGARTPQQVVVYDVADLSSPRRTVITHGGHREWQSPEYAAELVEPTVHVCTNALAYLTYRVYCPTTPTTRLIVWVHGGPVDQWQVTFRPRIAFWNSRGWAVAVVDPTGTTGHGRMFMEKIHGTWGSFDATDTWSIIQDLHNDHQFSPDQTVVMGGSSGGLTAANVASHSPERVAGVVLQYPVIDVAQILVGDDPFESHYMAQLIGSSDATSEKIRFITPLTRASVLAQRPILVFHGDSDTSVPLVHSQRLHDAVTAHGGTVDLVVFEGEGHGFRRPENILRELEITESFLAGL
jgi:dipeptidyl aminopeptidase/acylaminoacyl peptidase